MAMVVAASCMGQHIKFFGVFQTLGLLSSGNPGDPAQRGSHAPPHRKNQDTNFSAVQGVSRSFLSGHPPNPQRECVPKILGRSPRKKSGHQSPRSIEACPDCFFRKPQRECVPKISGTPPLGGGSRGVRGSRCSLVLFLLVSSNTPFILL